MEHHFRSINVLGIFALLTISGCMNFSVNSEPAKPIVDRNAVTLIERIKAGPSRVSGGGMIYQLFVGGHFDAKLDQREGTLTLADIETNTQCQYDSAGLLMQPANVGNDHIGYCAELTANTVAMLDR